MKRDWFSCARFLPAALIGLTIVIESCSVSVGPTESTPGSGTDSWQTFSTPAGLTRLRDIAFNSSGHIFLAERSTGLWRSTNGGASWQQINTGLSNLNGWSIDVRSDGTLFASTYGNGSTVPVIFYRSTDNGDHWTQFGSFVNVSLGPAFSGVCTTNSGRLMFAGRYVPSPHSGGFYSTDSGTSVSEIATNPVSTAGFAVGCMTTSPFDVWYGSEAAGVYRSIDDGLTFNQIAATSGVIGNTNDIEFANSKVLTASQGGIFQSSDQAGTSWTNVLPVGEGRTLAKDNHGVLYYGHDIGTGVPPTPVYRSTTNGDSWTPFNQGLPDGLGIMKLAINPVDGRLYAAPDGPQLYRTVNAVQ
jgi:photosystem II stability/assembly factor-like uncharacterized protein